MPSQKKAQARRQLRPPEKPESARLSTGLGEAGIAAGATGEAIAGTGAAASIAAPLLASVAAVGLVAYFSGVSDAAIQLAKDIRTNFDGLAAEAIQPIIDGLASLQAMFPGVTGVFSDFQTYFVAGLQAIGDQLKQTSISDWATEAIPGLGLLKGEIDTLDAAVKYLGGDMGFLNSVIPIVTQSNMDTAHAAAVAAGGFASLELAVLPVDPGIQAITQSAAAMSDKLSDAQATLTSLQIELDTGTSSIKGYDAQQLALAVAQDNVTKAQNALNTALGNTPAVLTPLAQATRDFITPLLSIPTAEANAASGAVTMAANTDQLVTSLGHANDNLAVAQQNYANAKTQADALGLTSTPALEQATTRLNAAFNAQQTAATNANNALLPLPVTFGSAADNANNLSGQAFNAGVSLANMGGAAGTAAPQMTPINQAMIDFGTNAGKAHTSLATLTGDLPTWVGALNSGQISSGQFDQGLQAIDKDIQQISKTDLPGAIAAYGALGDKLSALGAPQSAVLGAFQSEEAAIQKMAQTDLPAAIAAQQAYIDKVSQIPGAYQLATKAQTDMLNEEVTWAHQTGQDASGYLIQLQAIKDKISGAGPTVSMRRTKILRRSTPTRSTNSRRPSRLPLSAGRTWETR